MRFFSSQYSPIPLLHLTITVLFYVRLVHANPSPKESWSQLRGLSWSVIFGRGTSCAKSCGWNSQLCCASDEACYTDASDQAQCSKTTAAVVTTTQAAVAASGYWQYYTTVYTETDLVTVTSTYSSAWCASTTAAAWVATTSAASTTCNYDLNESSCGSICCASDQYCYVSGQCKAAAGGSSGAYSTYYVSTGSYSAALRPTSSTIVVVTATNAPTTTVPFVAPVATGANITLTSTAANNSGGLSGGAIAGIVIGVLVGLILLALLLLFCCARGIWHALFGGGKKRSTERTEYYESHRHSSGGGAAAAGAGGRTWYGSRPARVETRKEKKSGGFKELLGIGAGLAGLAAVLGMKRGHDRRRDDEKSDLSSNYYSYYTSESSASSDDRRTRDTRRSSRHR